MPVLSPTRNTTSSGSNLYTQPSTSRSYTKTTSSSSGYVPTYRSNSLSKPTSSTYSSSYSSGYSSNLPSSYLPRASYRSSLYSSSSSSLTGGSSSSVASSTYRSSYLTGGNNDTTTASSRFGQQPQPKLFSTKLTSTAASGSSTGILKNGNQQYIGLSTYKDQNFLKKECDLARSQVVASKLRQFENDADNFNNNNNSSTVILTNSKITISPLIHKPSNKSKIETNNNMNCLQNNSELLDDIKFIDSDETDRQQQQQHHHQSRPHTRLRPKSSIISSSSQSLFDKVTSYKLANGVNIPTTLAPSSSATATGGTTSSAPSTLPLSTKKRDFISSIDSSSIKASIIKYNTLSELKRIPTRSSTGNLLLNSSTSQDSDRDKSNIRLGALKTSSSLLKTHSSNKSSESSPSMSPQTLRKTTATSTSSLLKTSSISNNLPVKSTTVTSTTTATRTTAAATTATTDKKLPNKLCDIDESVRNASIRSGLPPASPTSSRYWDRDRDSSSSRVSALSSRNLINDNDDYTTSHKNNSSSSSALNSYSDSSEKQQSEGLCGLRNIGNTCFMNSVIQCLSHTTELTKFLKSQTNIKSSTKDQQILYEFAKLIREMWTPNVHTVTPHELKSAFSTKHRMYSGYNQQDAQEFLRFFLDSLHCALNNGTKGEHLKIDETLSDNKIADLTWEWYSKIENSIVQDLFVGQLKSSLKCTTCGNTSVTFDPFWDLSVPLPSSSRCKLDACLDLFIREEVLDGDEMPTCSKCQTRRKCTKSFTIQRFPKYLVIHLKRFSETRWSKMSNIVEFPTGERELNMAPYASNNSTNVHYTLYAISNHMGSTAGGHYVALCKHPVTKKWHEFNDNIVSDDLSESVLVSSSAYLLFYERAN